MIQPSKTHAVVRTSPKGTPFVGRCIQCGRRNLTIDNSTSYCDNIVGLTEDEALLIVIAQEEAGRS